ncbi:hypothetical protein V5799_015863 [Amblyomma americanum]|uniref:Uncharacterized protein n=1 Tax=Amblyomma americanum TaxID=6943 RepID=A0AAQ4F848_AMBAM
MYIGHLYQLVACKVSSSDCDCSLSPGAQLGVSRLASRWADALRSRGLLSAPPEPRLSASVALLRAVATLHRSAIQDSGLSSCHHGPSRTVPRCLVMDVSPFPCADDALLNTQFVMVKRADGRSEASVELFLRKLRPERREPSRAHASRGMVTLHRVDVPSAAAGFDLLVHIEPEQPIDLLQVSRGVRERHLLVSSCVLALWLLYGAVLLWAYRADQRDEVYNTVTDLQQNLPTDQQPYIVTIITGFRRNAGTTSKARGNFLISLALSAIYQVFRED